MKSRINDVGKVLGGMTKVFSCRALCPLHCMGLKHGVWQ